MRMIHVNRDGAYLGVIDLERLKRAFENGVYRLTDFGWQQGMEDWQPLEYFLKIKELPLDRTPPLKEEKKYILRQTRRTRLGITSSLKSPKSPPVPS